MKEVSTIEEYIAQQSSEHQKVIEKMRALIKKNAPKAYEKISYRMPTYTMNNQVIAHFHTAKNHLGFYPTPEGVEAFRAKTTEYKTAKGVIQFPYKNIPFDLIKEIIEYRVLQIKDK